MTRRLNITKRILMLCLVAWITFLSVFGAYERSVEAAEWIAGAVAAVGGAGLLTALAIGGVVVAGGIAVYEIATTDAEDYRNFASSVKEGFQEFCAERETAIAKEQNAALSDAEAADIGVQNARDTVSNFWDNAVDVTKETGKNLKKKSVDMWKEFCDQFNEVTDHPEEYNQTTNNQISADKRFTCPVYSTGTHSVIGQTGGFNVGANTICIDGAYYCTGGQTKQWGNTLTYEKINGADGKTVSIYAVLLVDRGTFFWNKALRLFINTETGVITDVLQVNAVGESPDDFYTTVGAKMQSIIDQTNLPVIMCSSDENDYYTQFPNNYNQEDNKKLLQVAAAAAGGTISKVIGKMLEANDTKYGGAIKKGRENADTDQTISRKGEKGTVPIRKNTIKNIDTLNPDGTTSADSSTSGYAGEVGWSVPDANTWDRWISGDLPWSDVVGGTNTLDVPADDVYVHDNDHDVDIPRDTTVDDPYRRAKEREGENTITDDPAIPTPTPYPTPQQSIDDWVNDNLGAFVPDGMDLTELFPFCIPFDFLYLFQKFKADQAEPPIITFPIMYPRAIQGAMGSDRYNVVIDFADFAILRHIIRVFLLLMFIVGLMKITRNIIRG